MAIWQPPFTDRDKGGLRFIAKAIAAGLVLALAVLALRPLWQPPAPGAPGAERLTPRGPVLSFAAAVEAAAPSVVNVFTAKRVYERPAPALLDPFFRQWFPERVPVPRERLETSLGSGVIVGVEGIEGVEALVLTNLHVIRGAEAIQVALRDARTAPARLIGADAETDLAVLAVELEDLPRIPLGDSESLRVGDVVLAIGNPFGVGQTVTSGIVSALHRNRLGINVFEDFIQTDAAINPGNSGGALVNSRGELVGINTAVVARSGGAEGIGFAIPAATATEVMRQLLRSGEVTRGWLGIEAENLGPGTVAALALDKPEGVLVRAVLRNGPADLAGIEPGDVLTRVAGEQVNDSRTAIEAIARLTPGEPVDLTVLRAGRSLELQAMVSRRPAAFNPG